MTFGQELVRARKRTHKLGFGLIALIVVEVFGSVALSEILNMGEGPRAAMIFLIPIGTIIAAYFYQFRIIDPIIERGGDLFEKNALGSDLQKGMMDKVRG